MKKKSELERLTFRQYLEIILEGSNNSDTAMYYLLNKRMKVPLSRIYESYSYHLTDTFEDLLSNFFLYLRGESETGEGSYPSLRRLRDKSRFRMWLCITFRNFLTGMYVVKRKLNYSTFSVDKLRELEVDNYNLEERIHEASFIIAYTYQQAKSARQRLILIYALLRAIKREKTQHYKELADLLDMAYVCFRVNVHHSFYNLFRYRSRYYHQRDLHLYKEFDQMRTKINESFHKNLYETLFHYYKINYLK